jgi:methionyl-tRNA formyltransferase
MTLNPPQLSVKPRHRIAFMGTPEFAVPTLARLLAEQDVVGVFTQPDRPSGRGQRAAPSPVKRLAEAHGLPVFQPASLRKEPLAIAALAELAPDVVVVAAYGLLLPRSVLEVAPGGALNVHASLLPRWRGAAPVAFAILAGDAETGVTIMRMDVGLDTGPMLARRAGPIGPEDTAGVLTERLAEWGAELLCQTLPRWLAGAIEPEAQDDALATLARRLDTADGWLDWQAPAEALARRVRAMNPWPGAFTLLDGLRLKVHAATAIGGDEPADAPPGTVVAVDGRPAVVTGDGRLRLDLVQAPGGRAIAGADFARGRRGFVGARLALVLEPA